MASISKITLPSGDSYNLKVYTDNIAPQQTKTYTGVIATANNTTGGYLYFAKILPTGNNFYTPWRIRYRMQISIGGVSDGNQYCDVMICGAKDTYQSYQVWNSVTNTSYRPIYGHFYYSATQAGVESGIGHALGVRFYSAYNPTTAANARTFVIDVLETENCTVEFLDSFVTYADLPGTGATNYKTNNSFDGTTNGWTFSGDRNNYNYLLMSSDYPTAGTNKIYPYTLIMQKADETWESTVLSSSAGVSGKSANQSGFRPETLCFYNGGTTINAGGVTGGSVIYEAHYAFDVRYSFNGMTASASTSTLVPNKPFYIVGTFGSDGFFYLDTTKWWAQEFPPTDDGKAYVYVGMAVGVYQASLHAKHPVYKYAAGAWREIVPGNPVVLHQTDGTEIVGYKGNLTINKYEVEVAQSL